MSLDLNDPSIEQSWKDLTTANNETNWILWQLDGSKLVLKATGTGGLPELRSTLEGQEESVLFGGFQVIGVDDRGSTTSKRYKYIALTFVGSKVSVLKKAKVSVQRTEVQKKMKGFTAAFDFNDPAELTPEEISKILLKSGGAHKPNSYDFGGGETLPLDVPN